MSKYRNLMLKLSEEDYAAIQETIVLRKSGIFFDADRKLILPDTGSDLNGRVVAEVCRHFNDTVSSESLSSLAASTRTSHQPPATERFPAALSVREMYPAASPPRRLKDAYEEPDDRFSDEP